ncbi:hypothetical protein FACS1894162_7090 [Bacteroidia bacterium]|nr:hypothetical protein FACS1894162_7090 [Bacteroidia bacterium]
MDGIVDVVQKIHNQERRRLIRCNRSHNSLSYRVPREVIEALRKNKNYQPANQTNISIEELFDKLRELFEEKKDDELRFSALVEEIYQLLNDNAHLEFTRAIKKYALSPDNKILLLYFCHLFVENTNADSFEDRWHSLLKEENFKRIKERLADKGMRTGFACLFHGAPGTGKTETVYQIARETGRDIMLVDIAQTKSMWFGESEKKIKDIFDRYKACVKEAKIEPILLFNEADAVINCNKI